MSSRTGLWVVTSIMRSGGVNWFSIPDDITKALRSDRFMNGFIEMTQFS